MPPPRDTIRRRRATFRAEASINPAMLRRLFAREMPLFADCYRPKSPPIGRMIKHGRTRSGKLIVRDLEKAYSGLLIAR
jgi:hypothetical protein